MIKKENKQGGKYINISKVFSQIFKKIKSAFSWLWKYKVRTILVIIPLFIIVPVFNFIQEEPLYIRILPGTRGDIFNNFGGSISDNILGEGVPERERYQWVIDFFEQNYSTN